jgi:hypothetical protein
MSHVGVHFGRRRGGGGGDGDGGDGGGVGGHGVSRVYTTQSEFGTVLVHPSGWVIQCLWTPPGPVLQSDRTSNERHRGSALQFAAPAATHSTAVSVVQSAVERVVLGPQLQCGAVHPDVETHAAVVRLNPAGAAGQVVASHCPSVEIAPVAPPTVTTTTPRNSTTGPSSDPTGGLWNRDSMPTMP